VIYNASVVNFYNAMGSLARFENKNILFCFEKRSSPLQRWRCSCKFKNHGIGGWWDSISRPIAPASSVAGGDDTTRRSQVQVPSGCFFKLLLLLVTSYVTIIIAQSDSFGTDRIKHFFPLEQE
jgi:hypothetical protein